MAEPPPDRAARRAAARRRRDRTRRQVALLVLAAVLVGVLLIWTAFGSSGGGTHTAPSASRTSTSSSHGTATGATPAVAAKPTARVAVAAVGDTMMGSPPYGLPPDNGKYLFSAVKQYLVGNVVIVDQEGTLTGPTGTSKCGAGSTDCFAFRSPPSYAANLTAAGFTVANLADNHTFDFGAVGLANTVASLNAVGLPHTGLPAQYTIQHVGTTTVAILGFAPYNWCANSLDLPAVRSLVTQARRQADLVIVYFHAGTQGADAVHVGPGDEYVDGNPQGNVQQFAHTAVDAGADLVIGTGPHVLRGIQFYRGHMIAYSLGNFVGYKGFGLGGNLSTSGVLQATLTAAGGFVSARLRPVELDADGVPSPGGEGIALVQAVSKEDFGATAARISDSGVITPPIA